MTFLVDENLPYDVVSTAVEPGHSAYWVRNLFPGAPDAEVLERLRSTGEILVTRDVRFANLVAELLVVDATLAGVILNPRAAPGTHPQGVAPVPAVRA